MITVSDTVLVALCTAGGALLVKVYDRFSSKPKEKNDYDTVTRAEMRAEMEKMKGEIDKFRREVDEWKDRYYTLLKEHIQTQAQLEIVSNDLKELRTYLNATGVTVPGLTGTTYAVPEKKPIQVEVVNTPLTTETQAEHDEKKPN